MNHIHTIAVWVAVALVILTVWFGAGIAVALAHHLIKRAYQQNLRLCLHCRKLHRPGATCDVLDAQLRHDLNAEAEAIYQGDEMPSPAMPYGYRWPDEFCSYPPCEPEDGWVCHHHTVRLAAERVGKHRAPWSLPLDDQPAEVIAAIVTDLKEKDK